MSLSSTSGTVRRSAGGSTPPADHTWCPYLTKPTKAELNQAKKIYHTVVNTPTRSRAFIDTIDDALDRHDDDLKAARKRTAR